MLFAPVVEGQHAVFVVPQEGLGVCRYLTPFFQIRKELIGVISVEEAGQVGNLPGDVGQLHALDGSVAVEGLHADGLQFLEHVTVQVEFLPAIVLA